MTLSEQQGKDILAYIMLFIFVLVALYFTTACKTIEYLPGDTIREIEYKTKFEKEIVRFDSIVTKTDTFDNIVFRDRTVYQTKEHTKIDTVITDKEVIKMNPLNEKLKKDNDKLSNKVENRTRLSLYLSIALIVIIMFLLIRSKFR